MHPDVAYEQASLDGTQPFVRRCRRAPHRKQPLERDSEQCHDRRDVRQLQEGGIHLTRQAAVVPLGRDHRPKYERNVDNAVEQIDDGHAYEQLIESATFQAMALSERRHQYAIADEARNNVQHEKRRFRRQIARPDFRLRRVGGIGDRSLRKVANIRREASHASGVFSHSNRAATAEFLPFPK